MRHCRSKPLFSAVFVAAIFTAGCATDQPIGRGQYPDRLQTVTPLKNTERKRCADLEGAGMPAHEFVRSYKVTDRNGSWASDCHIRKVIISTTHSHILQYSLFSDPTDISEASGAVATQTLVEYFRRTDTQVTEESAEASTSFAQMLRIAEKMRQQNLIGAVLPEMKSLTATLPEDRSESILVLSRLDGWIKSNAMTVKESVLRRTRYWLSLGFLQADESVDSMIRSTLYLIDGRTGALIWSDSSVSTRNNLATSISQSIRKFFGD